MICLKNCSVTKWCRRRRFFRTLRARPGASTRNFLARKYPCSEKPPPRKTFRNSTQETKMLIQNKKAYFDYEVLEKFTAGVELFGFEVKSVRARQGSLEGSFVTVRGGEVYLMHATIPPFQPNNTPKNYEPVRNRRLLLTKKEIVLLANTENKKGLTIIPLSMYNSGRKIKLEIAIARGKKQFDKRDSIKKRESNREILREMKGH